MHAAFDSFGGQPRLVAGCSAASAAVIGYLAFVPKGSIGLGVIAGALCVTIGALIALVRTPMPSQIRTVLMIALIVGMLCLSLRAEFVLVNPVQRDLDHAMIGEDGLSRMRDTPSAPEPAKINIRGLEGNLHLEREARATLLGPIGADIPGAGAWRIDGEAMPDGQSDDTSMSIGWRVSGLGSDADCGVLSVAATNSTAAVTALGARFHRAIRKSVDARRATCE